MDVAVAGALIGAAAGVGGSLAGGLTSLRLAKRTERAQRLQWLLDQRLIAYREVMDAIEAVVPEPTYESLMTATRAVALLQSLSENDVKSAADDLRRKLGGMHAKVPGSTPNAPEPTEPLSHYVTELREAMNKQFLS